MFEFDHSVSIKVIRSKNRRRTIGIQVDGNEVTVRAPERTTDAEIRRLLKNRQNWIETALKKIDSIKLDHPVQRKAVWFQGDLYPLRVIGSSPGPYVVMSDSEMLVHLPDPNPSSQQIQTLVYEWYRTQASEWLPQRLRHLAKALNYDQFTVRVKEQKTRWGSCSAARNINLNWRLIMAPQEVADYVMIHELCHLTEMNHSPDFWALVQRAMPTYENSRRWLNENARTRLAW